MERLRSDVLVIGGGLAGLYAALRTAALGRHVLLATKSGIRSSNSVWAQGGIAAAVGHDDAVALHVEDTLAAGAGLCDRAAVEVLCAEAPRRLYDLEALGVVFDTAPDGSLELGLEGAHSRRRVLHAGGSQSGRRMAEPLIARVLADPRIDVLEGFAVEALAVADGRCGGALGTTAAGLVRVDAGATILATGGAGALYLRTTNPPGATGDGLALAFRAGAEVADVEFVQFHPTALAAGSPRDGFLLTEALRGEGARLVLDDGAPAMAGEPQGDLAPRDVVARAIDAHLAAGRRVLLDVTHLPRERVAAHFPNVVAALAEAGIDLLGAPVPVAPAAHYLMGGVSTDLHARTTVAGLLACGEVARTGVHGANRLASNSLLECFVFGHRAAEQAAFAEPAAPVDLPPPPPRAAPPRGLAARMWSACGLVRDASGLRALVDELAALPDAQPVLAARLIATAALRREESRGGHFRRDFPATVPALAHPLPLHREDVPCP